MKRRQAKQCVVRHCARPGMRYPAPTWQRVLAGVVEILRRCARRPTGGVDARTLVYGRI